MTEYRIYKVLDLEASEDPNLPSPSTRTESVDTPFGIHQHDDHSTSVVFKIRMSNCLLIITF